MFIYPKSIEDAKYKLEKRITTLKKHGYSIYKKSEVIIDNLSIDRYTIKSKKTKRNRLVLTIGLHGIEGYVGASSVDVFLNEIFPKIEEDTEVVIYFPLNPYGMKHFRRVNESNVDLNRNFTKNNFDSDNPSFTEMNEFFAIKDYKGPKRANISFYASVAKNIKKYGTKTIEEATLFGQKENDKAIYYTGIEHQKTTTYLLNEITKQVTDIDNIVWIDIHSGYGPRYQMSVVNSKYEKEQSKELIDSINYPLILGLEEDDFYDIDGDLIEKIYEIHKKLPTKSKLFATCFEFGTFGDGTKDVIKSLKALLFENMAYHGHQTESFNVYSKQLFIEQFLPSEEKWRVKAQEDFLNATTQILAHYKFIPSKT